MTAKTKTGHGAATAAHPPASRGRKLSVATWIATAFGLGYIPVAPGTWGSLIGAILYWGLYGYLGALRLIVLPAYFQSGGSSWHFAVLAGVAALVLAFVGVWSSGRAAKSSGMKDPQFVVIDEVSGQFLTYLFALSPANWKYLLLGFILFRVFDIWKPFPARQAESLPGGWGIMTDDWVAAIYAAGGLWIARAFGL